MKSFYLLILTFIGLSLSGCASTPSVDQATEHPAMTSSPKKHTTVSANVPRKNPIAITLFTHGKQPNKPYEIVGHETVSKFNYVGIKRQEAYLRDVMRNLAVALGGDAVINIKHDAKTITGTVIAYKVDITKKTNQA